MQISCKNCLKRFEVDDRLIPASGRMLQCSSCEHKWYFTKNQIIKEKKIEFSDPNKIEYTDQPNERHEKKEIQELINQKYINNIETKNKRKSQNINYFNFFLAGIISFTALIILIDTFQNQISLIYPNIDIILDNLYESLEDIRLFFIDLFK